MKRTEVRKGMTVRVDRPSDWAKTRPWTRPVATVLTEPVKTSVPKGYRTTKMVYTVDVEVSRFNHSTRQHETVIERTEVSYILCTDEKALEMQKTYEALETAKANREEARKAAKDAALPQIREVMEAAGIAGYRYEYNSATLTCVELLAIIEAARATA